MRLLFSIALLCMFTGLARGEDWPQLQGDALRSGNASQAVLPKSLGLVGAVALTDGIYAAPVVADGTAYVVDGSGVVHALDAQTLKPRWSFATRGGPGNCNNVAAPAVAGKYLHVGTMAGYYYVLDRASGTVARELDCREPIFTAPAVSGQRVYFATLGAQVYAVEADGALGWTWDFVKEVVKFDGNRWSGADWLAQRKDRVTWRDHFVCSRDLCVVGKTVVIPAGGRTVVLEDTGAAPKLRAAGEIPDYDGDEFPATFGQSADAAGNVYVQWHRRDNAGRVEILRLGADDKLQTDIVKGTQTAIHLPGLLSFAPVSVRGKDVYRVRPEAGLGLCRHTSGEEKPAVLSSAASIASPVLTREHAVYGGLDGKLYVVPLTGGEATALPTAFGSPITASVAVADGRVYVPCEDGYLYVFGANGDAPLPKKSLEVAKIRSPLHGPRGGGIRLVHQLWRLQLHQCQRAGARASAAHALGAAAGRNGQALAGLRRRPALYSHG